MPRGVQDFNGTRLEEARLARGLTQASLASMIEKNSTTVGAWESGRQAPDWESIERLSVQLKVKTSLFLQSDISASSSHFFRSNANVTLGLQKKSKALLRWAEIITDKLEEWIDFPAIDMPLVDRLDVRQIDDSYIENVASTCRSHWSLGVAPVSNVVELLEAAGAVVVREELGGVKMDGVSAWFGSRPYALLADDKASAVRSRFDAAHELGHLVMHRHIDAESLSRSEYQEMERQAHMFASSFLLPAEGFLRELRYPSLDTFIELKPRWGASVGAMTMRCEQLEVISPEQKSRLFRHMSARGWRKAEPLDDTL